MNNDVLDQANFLKERIAASEQRLKVIKRWLWMSKTDNRSDWSLTLEGRNTTGVILNRDFGVSILKDIRKQETEELVRLNEEFDNL